jgi:ferredoxin--NADP+ reductase
MCGGCRVNVGGKTVYACVDGPEFDAQAVDFKQLADRLAMYRGAEKDAFEGSRCLIEGLAEAAGGDSPR